MHIKVRPSSGHHVVPTPRPVKLGKMPRFRTTYGRFTTEVENFHGRLAMLGITGCALEETFAKVPVVQQWVAETGIPSVDLLAFLVMVTLNFVLDTVSPVRLTGEEPELQVWEHPGFTLETEILHGRIAMLAFAFVVVGEQAYGRLLL